MLTLVYVIGIGIGLACLLEGVSRGVYRMKYGMPFRSRVIGEYPYRRFIEACDPPLYFRLKKGFRSPMVHINRFRCRGPEPAPDGEKKRLLLMGESNFFGVKLTREEHLWSVKLEAILQKRGYARWEVLNAGNPTYNTFQHRHLWERELHRVRPEILILSLGGNDFSQAWMMGSRWEPGTPWPWEFILALERKSPWWNRLGARFCLYFLWRRRMTARKSFPRWDQDFQWERCIAAIKENYRAVVRDAQKRGARVIASSYAFAYDLNPGPEEARKLDAIQSNWRSFIEGRGEYDFKFLEVMQNEICPELDIPYIDFTKAFHEHPKRFEMYLDLAHFNEKGMAFVAQTLFQEIEALGWWTR